MTSFALFIPERDLRAGARVLRALLHHNHPMVQRAIADALSDSGRHEALSCVVKMEGALLTSEAPTSDLSQTLDAIKGDAIRAITEATGERR